MKKLKTSSRFTDNKDGTITDSKTNLIWAKEDDGEYRTWKEAIAYCKKNVAKLPGKGWRLPTREELLTIVDLEKYAPAADPVLNMRSSYYWSSTPYAGHSNFAWSVYFGYGSVDWHSVFNGCCVRPVRQDSL